MGQIIKFPTREQTETLDIPDVPDDDAEVPRDASVGIDQYLWLGFLFGGLAAIIGL